jgi:hypothetical protein
VVKTVRLISVAYAANQPHTTYFLDVPSDDARFVLKWRNYLRIGEYYFPCGGIAVSINRAKNHVSGRSDRRLVGIWNINAHRDPFVKGWRRTEILDDEIAFKWA